LAIVARSFGRTVGRVHGHSAMQMPQDAASAKICFAARGRRLEMKATNQVIQDPFEVLSRTKVAFVVGLNYAERA